MSEQSEYPFPKIKNPKSFFLGLKFVIIFIIIALLFILFNPFKKKNVVYSPESGMIELIEKKNDSLILEKDREIYKLTIQFQKHENSIDSLREILVTKDKVISDKLIELDRIKKSIKELTPTEQQKYWQDAFN